VRGFNAGLYRAAEGAKLDLKNFEDSLHLNAQDVSDGSNGRLNPQSFSRRTSGTKRRPNAHGSRQSHKNENIVTAKTQRESETTHDYAAAAAHLDLLAEDNITKNGLLSPECYTEYYAKQLKSAKKFTSNRNANETFRRRWGIYQ
jgi:hypothetical protein